MSELSSKFSRDDIKTLLDAMNDWESVGNQDFHILQVVKNVPMPAEDHEAYDYISQIKEHFTKREKDIIASQEIRQEQAVFLKAKLMMVRKELGITQLFDMAANADMTTPQSLPKVSQRVEAKFKPSAKIVGNSTQLAELQSKLELAEFYIKDLGVWPMYEKFLAEKQTDKPAEEKKE